MSSNFLYFSTKYCLEALFGIVVVVVVDVDVNLQLSLMRLLPNSFQQLRPMFLHCPQSRTPNHVQELSSSNWLL